MSFLAFTLSMAFRRKFRGEGVAFYVVMLALMTPGFLVGLGTQLFWSWMGQESSLWKTALGANVIWGIPFGFLIGTNRVAWRMFNPVVQLLRPVSPLAWFPIWLVVMTKADPAAVWTIFVTSTMPVIVNTAAGAASVPSDQHDVARVFKFSRLTELREVVVPHALPAVITGLRLSMGVAWLVIVASEMLSAASGIGFNRSYNPEVPALKAVVSAGLARTSFAIS